MMTQKTWTCKKFNSLLRGSIYDGFFQTKYEPEQYGDPNIMTPTSWSHENFERERHKKYPRLD